MMTAITCSMLPPTSTQSLSTPRMLQMTTRVQYTAYKNIENTDYGDYDDILLIATRGRNGSQQRFSSLSSAMLTLWCLRSKCCTAQKAVPISNALDVIVVTTILFSYMRLVVVVTIVDVQDVVQWKRTQEAHNQTISAVMSRLM
eukprot:301472-Amphidinium_carterae.1